MSELRAGVPGLIQDIARWRQAIPDRAPSYHRIFAELVALLEGGSQHATELGARFDEAWAQRTFQIFYDRPLLLIAALRNQALVAGPDHPLWRAIAAPAPDPESVTPSALLAALADDTVFELLRTNFVQTNETSRAVVWLWPAQLIGADDGARPLALFEVGTAAGLNLIAEHLPAPWTVMSGAALPIVHAPRIVTRLGIDAHPLDACSDRDANWLRACVWAGERHRIERIEAAIAAFRAAPVQIQRGDATDAPRLLHAMRAQAPERGVVLAFQTLMRDYLGEEKRKVYEREMRRWIEDSPIASTLWIELEVDHDDPRGPCLIVAHVRDAGGTTDILLGKTGPHPAAVTVDATAAGRFTQIFR